MLSKAPALITWCTACWRTYPFVQLSPGPHRVGLCERLRHKQPERENWRQQLQDDGYKRHPACHHQPHEPITWVASCVFFPPLPLLAAAGCFWCLPLLVLTRLHSCNWCST